MSARRSSSVGESARLIIVRSRVRVPPPLQRRRSAPPGRFFRFERVLARGCLAALGRRADDPHGLSPEENHDCSRCLHERRLAVRSRPHARRLLGPARDGHQGPRCVQRRRREDPRGCGPPRELLGRGARPGRQHRHPQRPARRAPAQRRLLRRRDVPRDRVPQHGRGRGRRERTQRDRRPHDPRHHAPGLTIPLSFTGIERDPFGNLRAGFEGTRRLDRRDFGLEWNAALDTGGVLVSEKITLEFEFSAIKAEEAVEG